MENYGTLLIEVNKKATEISLESYKLKKQFVDLYNEILVVKQKIEGNHHRKVSFSEMLDIVRKGACHG
jgi:hypothetical protein